MSDLTQHYQSTDSLWQQIEKTLLAADINPETQLNSDLLAPIDQLHIGGRQATQQLINQADLASGCRVLEIGSGLGGTARLLSEIIPCTITAIDITDSFSQAHTEINKRMSINNIRVVCADACVMQVPPASQDLIISQHTLMNIPDKKALLETLSQSLKPGGQLLLHEVIAGNNPEPIQLPVPWASDQTHSHLPDKEGLIALLEEAGLMLKSFTDVTDSALAWRTKHTQREAGSSQQGKTQVASPLNPRIIFGERFLQMGKNVMANLADDKVRVVEAVFIRQ